MKFVALVSGGKDSFYTIMECIRNGHELIACAHLSPRQQECKEGHEEEESYMYQTAASEAIPTLVEECLGVPLVVRQCVGRSNKTSLVYDHDDEREHENGGGCSVPDEVEDLYELIVDVQKRFPDVKAISSGAILSTYQRTRIESVCSRLKLTPLGYLWRSGTQRELLECMLKDGIEAVLVKVASPPGLMPRKHLNKTLGQLYYGGVFDKLKKRFDFHICGEGGEYESLVLDCPLFKKKLTLTEVEIVENDDGVGVLRVISCCATDKETNNEEWSAEGELLIQRILNNDDEIADECVDKTSPVKGGSKESRAPKVQLQLYTLPHVKVLSGGLAHVNEIMSQKIYQVSDLDTQIDVDTDIDAELAVLEAQCIFRTLGRTLSTLDWECKGRARNHCKDSATAKDVVFVHLYLSSIGHFTKINAHYQKFFGIVLPPSRSCVAVGENVIPGGRRVMLDCVIQRGSGTYMRVQPDANLDSLQSIIPKSNANFIKQQHMNPHHKLRSTLHVQTISHWAPICVGPYSQANTLRSSLILLAGQIGLIPGTMTLVEGGWSKELAQCWKNAACVMDALNGSLNDILGAVLYISSDVIKQNNEREIWDLLIDISRTNIRSNGGVNAGRVDETKSSNDEEAFGGYEDFETWKAMAETEQTTCIESETDKHNTCTPLLMVAIPQMPKGAVSEVELICASNKATSNLDIEDTISWSSLHSQEDVKGIETSVYHSERLNWDIGNDGTLEDDSLTQSTGFKFESSARSIGKGCIAVAQTISYFDASSVASEQCISLNLRVLLYDMIESAMQTLVEKSNLNKYYTMNVRLYYVSSSFQSMGQDPSTLRYALNTVIGAKWPNTSQVPAYSVVPVDAIFMSPASPVLDTKMNSSPIMGMQIMCADLIHTETEMWINHNRNYN